MNYLRTQRLKTALSQEEVGFLLGSEAGRNVSRHELGDRVPNPRMLLSYAFIYDVPAERLFAEDARKVEVEIRKRAGELLTRTQKEAPSPSRRRRIEVLSELASREPREL